MILPTHTRLMLVERCFSRNPTINFQGWYSLPCFCCPVGGRNDRRRKRPSRASSAGKPNQWWPVQPHGGSSRSMASQSSGLPASTSSPRPYSRAGRQSAGESLPNQLWWRDHQLRGGRRRKVLAACCYPMRRARATDSAGSVATRVVTNILTRIDW